MGIFIGKIGWNLNLENVWEIESKTSPFPNLCSFEKKTWKYLCSFEENSEIFL